MRTLEQVSQEYFTLSTIENAFGEFNTEDSGLNATIDTFFNSLQDLILDTTGAVSQNQIVADAENLAAQFRSLSSVLTEMGNRITLEVQNSVESVNALATQVAELNKKIQDIETIGGSANNLIDQRDQCISKLSQLIGVQTLSRDFGVVNVTVGPLALVAHTYTSELESGLDSSGDLGIAIKDSGISVLGNNKADNDLYQGKTSLA